MNNTAVWSFTHTATLILNVTVALEERNSVHFHGGGGQGVSGGGGAVLEHLICYTLNIGAKCNILLKANL